MGTALSEMYGYTMPELPGCSKIQQLRNIVEAIREWCERTQAWEQALDAMDIVDGKSEYQMDSPIPDTEVICPVHRPSDDIGVHLDERLLSPGVEYTIPVDKDVIILETEPVADITDGLTVTVALQPILSASADVEVPDRLFSDWHDVWAKGAMSRLMLMPDEDWSNEKKGVMYHNIFWDGIRLGIAQRTRGRTNRSLRIQHPANFA